MNRQGRVYPSSVYKAVLSPPSAQQTSLPTQPHLASLSPPHPPSPTMSLITRDGVYLVTNVAYPTHYLISDPRPAATNNALQCWRLEQDPQTSRWTMRAIVSHYAQHLNYGGEGSSYLSVGDDSGQRTAVVDDKTWLTLQPIRSEEQMCVSFTPCASTVLTGVVIIALRTRRRSWWWVLKSRRGNARSRLGRSRARRIFS